MELSCSDVTMLQPIRGAQEWSISQGYWPRDSQAHGGGKTILLTNNDTYNDLCVFG